MQNIINGILDAITYLSAYIFYVTLLSATFLFLLKRKLRLRRVMKLAKNRALLVEEMRFELKPV